MGNIGAVAVYWEARRADVGDCAHRLECTFSSLLQASSLLSNWESLRGAARKKKSDPESIKTLTRDQLAELLRKGVNKKDSNGEPIPDLGFSASFWNGYKDENAAGIRATCGSYTANPNLGNSVVLQWPESLACSSAENFKTCINVLTDLAVIWQADWGIVSGANSDHAQSRVGRSPYLDQALWIREGIETPPGVADADSVSESGSGKLYIRNASC